MGSVTFYEDTGLTGNGITFEIGYITDYQILLYNNTETPITIRSIENNTNYFITLYYKKDDNAFGGNYIYIKESLNDIQQVQYRWTTILPIDYAWSKKEISPEFNGIVLQQIVPDSQEWYVFNTIFFNLNKEPFDKDNVVDMTYTFNETINKTKNISKSNFKSTTASSTLDTAPIENDVYEQCKQKNQEIYNEIDDYTSRVRNCNDTFDRDVRPLFEEKKDLHKTIYLLEQQNAKLKSNYNGSSITFIHLFIIFVDLLILFYILYKHNIIRFP